MTGINRRDFLKNSAAIGGSLILGNLVANPAKALAAQEVIKRPDGYGMLSDTTKCIGCRACEAACNEAHGLPAPEIPFTSQAVYKERRRTSPGAFTVVNRYENPAWQKPVFRKQQCMHCEDPACASACLVAALKKTPEGPVVYNEKLCVGCRYCMTACPFSVPTFEYFDPRSPAIRKCSMCYEKSSQGITPACAAACPMKAINFGKKSELLKIARDKIDKEPDKYIDRIFGEREVGGTNWLYISGVPFEQLGFPANLEMTSYPEFTRDFLSAVPLVLIIWPALFGGIYSWTQRREELAEAEAKKPGKEGSKK